MFIIFLIFVVILLYVYVHLNRESRLIDKMFPGPLRLPFIGTLSLKLISPEGFHNFFLHFSRLYHYQPYRIWVFHKSYIIIPDFKLAKVVLSKLKFTDKADFYDAFEPWLGRNHFIGSGDEWLKCRKAVMPAFQYRQVVKFLKLFQHNCDILCEKLSNHDDKNAFDVSKYISKYSLDNTSESFLGAQVEARNSEHCPYEEAFENLSKIAFLKLVLPILRVVWIFNITPLSRLQKNSMRILRNFSGAIIREKRSKITKQNMINETDSGENDVHFLDIFLKGDKAESFTDEEIQMEIESGIFAGHGTLTSALSFIFYALAEHQEIQKKVYEELRGIFGESTGNLDMNQLNEMKYAEQVIRETLRFYTAVPLIGRNIKEDLYIGEKLFIPKDTNIIISLASIHRDPINWPNPDVFDPDRFSPELARNRDPFTFLVFSAGPRNCSGYCMAMIMVKLAIAQVIHKFHLSLDDDPQHKVRPAYNIVLTSTNGFQIKIRSRSNIQ